MVDQSKLNLIGYGGEGFATPLFSETLARVLGVSDLRAGDTAADLGCGHGQMALWFAEARGLRVTAVEKLPAMAEAARERTSGRWAQGAGSVEVVEASALEFLERAGRFRLLAAVGAARLLGGMESPAEVFAALKDSVEPGGWLLWGETFWKSPPSPRLQMMTSVTGVYGAHAEYVAAGEAAGLTPTYAAVSSEAEWDDYVWRYVAAVEAYARAEPGEPDAAAMVARARAWRGLYLEEARACMGFGLYLFRRG